MQVGSSNANSFSVTGVRGKKTGFIKRKEKDEEKYAETQALYQNMTYETEMRQTGGEKELIAQFDFLKESVPLSI